MKEPYRCECGSVMFNEHDWRSDALYCANCRRPASRKEVYPVQKHTPGPWFVDMARNIGGWNGDVAVTRNGRIIAVAFVCRDETLANANLIATAPEMYEALKEAKWLLETYGNNNLWGPEAVASIEEIDRVLAKVEGKEG